MWAAAAIPPGMISNDEVLVRVHDVSESLADGWEGTG